MTDQTRWRIARDYLAQSGGVIGRVEMAKRWGVSRQRIHQYTEMSDFPAPVGHAGVRKGEPDMPVWMAAEVDAWKQEFYPEG